MKPKKSSHPDLKLFFSFFLSLIIIFSLNGISLAQAKKDQNKNGSLVSNETQTKVGSLTSVVPKGPLTVAESSNYTATALHSEVLSFIKELEKLSPNLVVENIGTTVEGRPIPMLILSDPPIFTPSAAHYLNKTVIYIEANIHAGEVEGKEASLRLAREILLEPHHPYLNKLVILIVPDLNADGNDKISPQNRPQQPGPENGVGIRYNAQNLDLNRDLIKLESLEMNAVVKNILNRWDPALVVDCHTTDGAYHQETVTYSWPLNPNADSKLLLYQRETMLPAITKILKGKYNTLSVPYGMFRDWKDPSKGWETFEHLPRYFTNYVGLRNRLSILDENYVHADYRTRVLSCFNFLKAILDYASAEADEIQKMIEEADSRTILQGLNPQEKTFGIEFDLQPLPQPVTINAYELEVNESSQGGFPQLKPTDRKRPVTVPYFANYVPKKTVSYPYAYLIPVPDPNIVKKLLAHGLLVEELTEEQSLKVETFTPTEIKSGERAYQGHHLNQVKGSYQQELRKFPSGSLLIKTAQPLGYLAAYLLEPLSDDGLIVWNFFDSYLVGQWQRGFSEVPVYRLLQPVNLPATRINEK
ncbi:MAG TPA: hypothetical protein ENO29_05270 [Candidatus Aminicenantes bacterium]|nr:hypothetical protein [Candidatus Aminicenantes bacterium]